jgi:hypothetical protein
MESVLTADRCRCRDRWRLKPSALSKDRLDVMVLPEQQCFSVRNDAAGWAELVERLHSATQPSVASAHQQNLLYGGTQTGLQITPIGVYL